MKQLASYTHQEGKSSAGYKAMYSCISACWTLKMYLEGRRGPHAPHNLFTMLSLTVTMTSWVLLYDSWKCDVSSITVAASVRLTEIVFPCRLGRVTFLPLTFEQQSQSLSDFRVTIPLININPLISVTIRKKVFSTMFN